MIEFIGAVTSTSAAVLVLWAIGSAMMNGIAQSDMGKCMLAAVICALIAILCLG